MPDQSPPRPPGWHFRQSATSTASDLPLCSASTLAGVCSWHPKHVCVDGPFGWHVLHGVVPPPSRPCEIGNTEWSKLASSQPAGVWQSPHPLPKDPPCGSSFAWHDWQSVGVAAKDVSALAPG